MTVQACKEGQRPVIQITGFDPLKFKRMNPTMTRFAVANRFDDTKTAFEQTAVKQRDPELVAKLRGRTRRGRTSPTTQTRAVILNSFPKALREFTEKEVESRLCGFDDLIRKYHEGVGTVAISPILEEKTLDLQINRVCEEFKDVLIEFYDQDLDERRASTSTMKFLEKQKYFEKELEWFQRNFKSGLIAQRTDECEGRMSSSDAVDGYFDDIGILNEEQKALMEFSYVRNYEEYMYNFGFTSCERLDEYLHASACLLVSLMDDDEADIAEFINLVTELVGFGCAKKRALLGRYLGQRLVQTNATPAKAKKETIQFLNGLYGAKLQSEEAARLADLD